MKEYNIERFSSSNWSLVLIKNNQIVYRSKKPGLQPLVFCLKYKKDLLRNAIVYDKLIGRAAALLMVYGRIGQVMTPVISRSALIVFKKNKIKVEYKKTTGKIMNRAGDDICPMEKLSKNKTAEQFAQLMINK